MTLKTHRVSGPPPNSAPLGALLQTKKSPLLTFFKDKRDVNIHAQPVEVRADIGDSRFGADRDTSLRGGLDCHVRKGGGWLADMNRLRPSQRPGVRRSVSPPRS